MGKESETEKKKKSTEIDLMVIAHVHRPSFSWEWGSEGLHRETSDTIQAKKMDEKFAIGVTPLMIACAHGAVDIVSEILDFDDEGSTGGTGEALHAIKRVIPVKNEEHATHEILFDKFPLPGVKGKEKPFVKQYKDKDNQRTSTRSIIKDYSALFMVLDIIHQCKKSKERERLIELVNTQTEIANKILGEMLFQTSGQTAFEELNWPKIPLLGHKEECSTPILCTIQKSCIFFFSKILFKSISYSYKQT